jgi:hypothetical protein
VIAANQAGNANYTAAPQATQTIAVGAGAQSLTFGLAPTLLVGGTGTVTATGGASGNAVTFTSTTPAVCTVGGTNGSVVTGVTAGSCVIAANQTGNANYTAAVQATQTIAVGAGAQSLTFGLAPTLLVGGTGSVAATGGASGNVVTFTSTTSAVCTVGGTNGSLVTGVTAGSCVIAANQTGTANYTAAPQATQTIAVGAGAQSLTFGLAPTLLVGGTGSVAASGGASGNAVTFSSTTSAVCTVGGTNGSVVTGVAAGSCVIAANQTGNANYTAAPQATQTIAVGAGAQSLNFGSALTVMVGSSAALVASGGASGSALVFSSTTPGVCSVAADMVTGLSVGDCMVAANQAGNANYTAAAQVTQSIAVGKGAQSIRFAAVPVISLGDSGMLSAAGGASGEAVTFASTTPSVCSVQGSQVSSLGAGDCSVAADQAGNANYTAAAQVVQTITIAKASLTLQKGWNLLGNASNQPVAAEVAFADAALVSTVWKWDTAMLSWQFYTPTLSAAELQSYAQSKNYGVLKAINPGDGFWVNAKAAATLSAVSGAPYSLGAAQLRPGWNLVATADNATPAAFNLSLTDPLAPPPAAGVVPINLTTLWAWNNPLSKWYFYSPQLEGQSGTALFDYTASKGYLDFVVTGKTLGAGTGFWVNKP